MTESRERTRGDERRDPEAPSQGPSAQNLARRRQAGSDLLASADAAISRALSADSEAFLLANRQEGGE